MYRKQSYQADTSITFTSYATGVGRDRSDYDITGEILSRIESDRRIDPSSISITVDDGVVTLSGEVNYDKERDAAEEDAFAIPGVIDVHNHILVLTE